MKCFCAVIETLGTLDLHLHMFLMIVE